MPPVVISADIDCPAAEVFACATDPARFREWQKGVVDGHMDGPAGGTGTPVVGARCVTPRRVGGASRPSTAELVYIDPPKSWGVRGIDGPIRAAVDVRVEPLAGSRSRLTISVDFTGRGVGKILVPLMVRGKQAKRCPATWQRSSGGWKLARPPRRAGESRREDYAGIRPFPVMMASAS